MKLTVQERLKNLQIVDFDLMPDAESYADHIADMRITNMNAALEAVQAHEQPYQSA